MFLRKMRRDRGNKVAKAILMPESTVKASFSGQLPR
jgi:hypothetical protein